MRRSKILKAALLYYGFCFCLSVGWCVAACVQQIEAKAAPLIVEQPAAELPTIAEN